MRFRIFPLHLSKVWRLPRKSEARYEVLRLSPQENLLTSLMIMSLVLRLPRKMHLCRSSSNAPRLPSFLEMRQNPHVLLTFDKVHSPLRLPHETTSERPVPLSFLHF